MFRVSGLCGLVLIGLEVLLEGLGFMNVGVLLPGFEE